jgi:hypothetical protein
MTNPSFASLHANLLARKGEAKPSGEPRFGSMPWQPPAGPPPRLPPSAPPSAATTAAPSAAKTAIPSASAAAAPPPSPPPTIGADPAQVRVRLQDTPVWPARKPVHAPDNDGTGWVAAKPQAQPEAATAVYKTTVRLTHAQARAVKLAALVLDRPQQEILTAGLLDRLEKLACQDLAKCACFNAVLEGLKAAEPTS